MASVLWYKRSIGLVTRVDPARDEYSEREGVRFLAEAYNVDVGETGDVSRRLGYSLSSITVPCHSLFCDDGICLFVAGDALCLLSEDMTYKPIRNVTAGAAVSYAQLGDTVYYANGRQIGAVVNGASWEWSVPQNVTSRLKDNTRVYTSPPVGSIVKLFAGRAWIAEGNTLWFSEPFQYSIFAPARNYISFPGRIIMLAPVQDGMYISTDKVIYFLGGADPNKMDLIKVASYPVVRGTDVVVDGITVEGGKYSKLIAPMWTTTQGICLGAPGGHMYNLTHDRLVYPRTSTGCALYTGKKYIVSMDDGLTIAMELSQGAISQYGNFSFNSMCRFGDKLLGANDSGIFVLEDGDKDNGADISAFFKIGPTDFGIENEKRLRRIYIGGRLDGRLKLAMSADDGEEVERELLPVDTNLRMTHQDVSGGRDIRGRFLSLKVSNVLGSDFTISTILAVLLILGQNAKEGE